MFAGKIFKILAVFLVAVMGISAYQTCLSCKGIVHARDCDTIERCGPSSSCYIDGRITQLGFLRFNLGCRDVLQCLSANRTSGRREADSGFFCSQCCSGDLCNTRGCKEEGYPPPGSRGPVCYNCPNQQSTDDCQIITVCRTGDVCKLRRILYGQNNEIRYETKCEYREKCYAEVDFYKQPWIVGRKRVSEEFKIGNTCMVHCCGNDLCNVGCSNTSAMSTSTSALTPTISTSVMPTPVIKPSVEILISDQDKVFSLLGSSLTLTCESKSFPVPTVTWSLAKNGVSTMVINSATLTFTSLQPSQLGNYTCTARNAYGSTSKTISVISNVTGALDCESENLDTCLWTNNPLDEGQWVNSGVPAHKTSAVNAGPVLRNFTNTGNVLYTQYEGAQTDKVVDLVSPELGPSGPTCLSFLYHIDQNIGDQIQVETATSCEGYTVCNNSMPKTVIIHGTSGHTKGWRLAQIWLPAFPHNHKLIIRFIHSRTGTRNGSSAIDNIKYAGGDCKPSMTLTGQREVFLNVDKNSDLRLACQIQGFPTPTYSWTKQGGCGSFHNVTGSSVLISRYASKGDGGTYVCTASNSGPGVTSLSQTFHVNVNAGAETVCTFEHGLCGWTQDGGGDFKWTPNSGQTLSQNTGPDADHTLRNGSGIYMYIEASSPRKQGDTAVLRSHRMAGNQSACFSFFYHMWGNDTGQLAVSRKDTCTEQQAIMFTEHGNRGDKWLFRSVNISATSVPNDYHIEVSARVGASYHGDIAIDDLLIKNGTCSSSYQ